MTIILKLIAFGNKSRQQSDIIGWKIKFILKK